MLIFGCLLLSAHAQYLNNIITVRYAQVGMEFFRNKFGVQYMLDAIRQFYRYVLYVICGISPFMFCCVKSVTITTVQSTQFKLPGNLSNLF